MFLDMAVEHRKVVAPHPSQAAAMGLLGAVSASFALPSEVLLNGDTPAPGGSSRTDARVREVRAQTSYAGYKRAVGLAISLMLVSVSAGIGWLEFSGGRNHPLRVSTVYSVRTSPQRSSGSGKQAGSRLELRIEEPKSGIAYVVAVRGEDAALLSGSLTLPESNRYLIDVEPDVSEYHIIVADAATQTARVHLEEKLVKLSGSSDWSVAIAEMLRSLNLRQFACTKLNVTGSSE
jgi:hypothetical protein